MSDKRRPEPSQGGTDYLARLQPGDTAAPWAPAPVAGPAPATPGRYPALAAVDPYPEVARPAVGVAAVPRHSADIVAAEVYQVCTPGHREPTALLPAPAFAERIPTSVPPVRRDRPRRRRGWQLALACAVTLAGLAAIGVGYVAFTRTGNITEAAKAPAIPAVPSIGRTLPAEATAPGVDPVATLPVSPTVAATTTSPANAATTTAGSAIQPAIVAAVPASPADSAPTEPPAPRLAAPRAVTAGTVDATLSYTAEKEGDGIAGYVGTIEISDSGAGDATDWRLTLTVPGGNSVLARGPVEVTQSGEEVQFTPAGDDGAVPAGGSLTFTFTVRGDLTDLPGNCTINGHACS